MDQQCSKHRLHCNPDQNEVITEDKLSEFIKENLIFYTVLLLIKTFGSVVRHDKDLPVIMQYFWKFI